MSVFGLPNKITVADDLKLEEGESQKQSSLLQDKMIKLALVGDGQVAEEQDQSLVGRVSTREALASSQASAVEEVFDLGEMLRRVEEVAPVGRQPANLRPFLIQIEGRTIPFAMMAHPEKYGSPYGKGDVEGLGIDSRAALRKIQAAGFRTLIALDNEEFAEIKKRWEAAAKVTGGHHQIHLFHVEDNTAPSLDQLKEIVYEVRRSSAAGLPVAVYCGAGFGRSGVIGAAVVLRELIAEEAAKGRLHSALTGRTAHITDIDGNLKRTTPTVAAAIQTVRAKDPENGYNLLSKNGRASKIGPTVEHRDQFDVLERLEVEFRK